MTRAGCHRTIIWLLSNGGNGLSIDNDIHSTDFCYVIILCAIDYSLCLVV